jgi:tetratricopeptide (TPR) repeat protein
MKKTVPMLLLFLGATLAPGIVLSQDEGPITEEESAEVSFEEYSDEFQQHFFEGLKQQGIQNYDKAINAFLKCRNLEPEKEVVSFELAKSYLLDKQYINAQEYAQEAVLEDPENYWYANTLAETLQAQNTTVSTIRDQIPWNNRELKSNLATIYYELGNYQEAKNILMELEKTVKTEYLQSKINDSIAKQRNITNKIEISENKSGDAGDLGTFEKRIQDLINASGDTKTLLELTEEALEKYPLQPFLYYANGVALKMGNTPKKAKEALETALDYLIDDPVLENKIYKELSEVYGAMGNTQKAIEYLNKMKPGF